MTTRISIYDNTGTWLAEIDANVKRSWKLNEYGSGSFTMSTLDDKATEANLQFGNYIYMEHDKLPVWGGIIDTPRTWGNGKITSSIYSAEYVLKSRKTLTREAKLTGTPGSLFNQLTSITIGSKSIPIVAGNVYGGGTNQVKKYNYAILYDAINDIAEESGNDWDLTPSIDPNGKLYFIANWYEKKGVTRLYGLYEDLNVKLSTRSLTEQGEICSRVIIYGDASAWSSKIIGHKEDSESTAKYGYRVKVESMSSNSRTEIREAVKKRLDELKEPRKTLDITALDVSDTFNNIRIGDTLPATFYGVGFTADGLGFSENIRVLQMFYDDINNQLKLVCDEV